MEYVYAAMLLHSAGKDVSADAVTAVIKAADIKVDEAKVKSLVASLEGVNIDEAIEKSVAAAPAPAAAGAAAPAPEAEAKEEKPAEDDGKGEEEAASGLAALFG